MIFIIPLIIASALLIYFHLSAKNKQREMLIEKGINPDGLSIVQIQKVTNLTNGILFISIGSGLLLGYIIHMLLDPENFFIIYLISIFMVSGVGFIMNYFIYKGIHDQKP